MPQFMLLVSEDSTSREAISPGGLGRRTESAIAWLDGLRLTGQLSSASLLGRRGSRLTRGTDAMPRFVCSETVAPIRNCILIEADSRRDAIEIAHACPFAQPGTIDVFEIEARLVGIQS